MRDTTGSEQGTGNREQEVLLPRFLLQTLGFQGGSDYSCSPQHSKSFRMIPVPSPSPTKNFNLTEAAKQFLFKQSNYSVFPYKQGFV